MKDIIGKAVARLQSVTSADDKTLASPTGFNKHRLAQIRINRAKSLLSELTPGTKSYKDKKAVIRRMEERYRAMT